MEIQADDWVQAVGFINDDEKKCARKGSLGRVVEVYPDEESAFIYWERTETFTICCYSEFVRLCAAEARPRIGVLGTDGQLVADLIKASSEFVKVTVCETPADALQVRMDGGTVWGVRRGGEPFSPLPDVSEYLYPADARSLARIVRWKLRTIAPY